MKPGKKSIRYWHLALLVSSLASIQGCAPGPTDVFRGDGEVKAYSKLDFQNDPEDFQFVVMGDLTGGGRPSVFAAAVDLVNLVRPEFVVNVGDLIEGYIEDEAQLQAQWARVDDDLARLDMPFFLVPGNHDVNFHPSEKVWFDRVGADRSYSHFIYKDVLFLLIGSPERDNSASFEV